MRQKLSFCTLLFYCLLSTAVFAQKKTTPIEYNDKLASITDSLYNLGMEWGTRFQQIMSGDKNYGQLSEPRQKVAAFTNKKIAEVKREAAVGKGGDNLKAAVLNFLVFEKSMIETAFMPMEKLDNNSTQEEIDAAIKKLTDQAELEADALKKVNVAQEAYGKLHGFELEPAEEEDKD